MVFTSNKNPALWREDFDEDSTLLCALDRIFDEATVFKLRGESFRGKKLDTVSVQTGKVKACLLYTSDAADDLLCVGLGGRRINKKKKYNALNTSWKIKMTKKNKRIA